MRNFVLRKADAGLMRKLDPRQAEAIQTLHGKKLSYRDAAAELGIPINTLKTRLHRGRNALEVLRGEPVTARQAPRPADAAPFGEADSC